MRLVKLHRGQQIHYHIHRQLEIYTFPDLRWRVSVWASLSNTFFIPTLASICVFVRQLSATLPDSWRGETEEFPQYLQNQACLQLYTMLYLSIYSFILRGQINALVHNSVMDGWCVSDGVHMMTFNVFTHYRVDFVFWQADRSWSW